MSSRLTKDEALEKEDRINEMKNEKKNQPTFPHLLQAQQAPALTYAKVLERPGTDSSNDIMKRVCWNLWFLLKQSTK